MLVLNQCCSEAPLEILFQQHLPPDLPEISFANRCRMHQQWFEKATTFNIMFEGFITYGGMAGRDMNALAVGLSEVTEALYLENRIAQVEYLGKPRIECGIPDDQP